MPNTFERLRAILARDYSVAPDAVTPDAGGNVAGTSDSEGAWPAPLSPQQARAPSSRTAQVCAPPAATETKRPAGGTACP